MPASACAFVVVQHMDPTRSPLLVELLQRCTTLPVIEAADGTVVERNHVYVIPANRDLSIMNGVLRLLERSQERGDPRTIDRFFRALADEQGALAVAVVLSGMGQDGTEGAKAIVARGGTVFVQAPESAAFDSMPRSTISAVRATVGAPEELGALIQRRLERGPDQADAAARTALAGTTSAALPLADGVERVMLLVRTQTGHDFSKYKRSTLRRRIARRMHVRGVESLDAYADLMESDPTEAAQLFDDLLIGVTQFFRDPWAWDALAAEALPALIAAYPDGGTMRAWVPGCSTGEEPYSLAMVFCEVLERLRPDAEFSLQIFATDLNFAAIERARRAIYPARIAKDVTSDRLRRFFVPVDDGFRVLPSVREMVVFAPQNVVMDPPFTRLDIVICRNLLIYLMPELHDRLLPLFHFSLRPHGLLFLGTAESIRAHTDLFEPVVERARIFRRKDSPVAPRAARLALDFAPISLQSTPRPYAGNFTEAPLTPEQDQPGVPSREPERESAQDAAPAPHDLDESRRALATAHAEMAGSKRELQRVNEELQSANEELVTSREEMQSMNEELQTVNHELQSKLNELTLASNDMANLLNSTSIATLFLDASLCVRRFTTPMTSLIRLIPGDVGRPVTDLTSKLDFPALNAVVRNVLHTLEVVELEVPASDGRWFAARIMPYRTHDDRIDGVVLTFTDVTKAKTLEAALREAQRALESRLETQSAELRATGSPKEAP